MHKAIKFNKDAWQKSYIDINIELRKKRKMVNNTIFRKNMEKYAAELFSFLFTDTTLGSDNSLCFRCTPLEGI